MQDAQISIFSQATTPGDADGGDFPYNGIRNMLRPIPRMRIHG